MKVLAAICAFGGLVCAVLPAQQAASRQEPIRFDAVSVKPTTPNLRNGAMVFGMLDPVGGPGSDDPGRIRYPVINLKSLFIDAFRVKEFQIEGPDWLDAQWFEIEATMPRETTREQLSVMLQNLLSDRFGLVFHRESKQVSAYSLVVGKNGLKLKEHAKGSGTESSDGPVNWEEHAMGADGFRALPSQLAGRTGLWFFKGLRGNRVVFQQQTMQTLAGSLTSLLGRPVMDATMLTGKYDFILEYTPDDFRLSPGAEPLPRIFDALQSLGLRLEPAKAPEDVVVIDRLEKMPSSN